MIQTQAEEAKWSVMWLMLAMLVGAVVSWLLGERIGLGVGVGALISSIVNGLRNKHARRGYAIAGVLICAIVAVAYWLISRMEN